MGMDLLDCSFRIEKSFHFKFGKEDYKKLDFGRRPWDVTASELHQWVLDCCKNATVTPPQWSSWNRVRLELAHTTSKSPNLIHRDTLIVKDLGFS
jgi:hypothetical protein